MRTQTLDVEGAAEQLVQAWVSLRSAHVLDQEGTHNMAKEAQNAFGNILIHFAQHQALDDLVFKALGETLEECAPLWADLMDDDFDVHSAFHDDILLTVSSHFSQSTSFARHNRLLVGLPAFGAHNTLQDMIQRPAFLDVVRDSGVFVGGGQLRMLGVVPLLEAQKHMLAPQVVFNLMDAVGADANSPSRVQAAQQAFGLSHQSDTVDATGGYVVLMEYEHDQDTSIMLSHTEESIQQWHAAMAEWVAAQADSDILVRQHLWQPFPYREAVAVALADWTTQTMFLQHHMGGQPTDAISRFDVVVPDDHEDGVDLNDTVEVLGYTQDDELMGMCTFNAVVFGLLLPHIQECWSQWMDSTVEIFERAEFQQTHTKTTRTLH